MTGDLLKDKAELTLDDVCETCGFSAEIVTTYIQEGLIEVSGDDARGWRFSETHIVHLSKARRLERDLRLNPAGSVLVMELMAQIEQLKNRLKRFERP